MNLPRLGLVIASFCAAIVASATDVASKISAVTVYADRAVVTRTTPSLDLAGGATELVFRNLPEMVQEQSVQFSASGTAGVTILDVSTARAFLEHTPDERAKAAETHLEGLHKQLRALNDQRALLDARRTMIERFDMALTSPASKDVARPDLETMSQSLNFISEQRARIATETAELDEHVESLKRKIDAAQAEMAQLQGPAKRSVKHVTVRLLVNEPGAVTATLSYTVSGARWTPSYDVRVKSGETSADLSYFGVVRQHTGEDWKNVALTLSTARPSLGGAAPTLPAWEIAEFRPRPMQTTSALTSADRADATTFSMMAGARGQLSARAAVDAAGAAEKDASFMTAAVESGTTSASFKIGIETSIPSDGSTQKVPITQIRLAAQPEYMSVPKKQATAFLTSKVTNSGEYPLLAGPMGVFLDGSFVATTNLKTVMPGEQFDLALGADEGVAIKHRRVQKFVEQTGLTNSGTRYTYEYLLTIQNNKKNPIRIAVHDQLPLSRHEKIVIKQLAPTERELKADNEGLLKWTLDLKPGEKREITVKFTVEHPNDLHVTGID